MIKIVTYKTKSGKNPYLEWLRSLDVGIKIIVSRRLDRLKAGNFGDTTPVKGSNGIKELRLD